MGNYNRDSKFKRKNSSGREGRGRSDHGQSSSHRATCAECGDACKVPFKPTGDRSVFCSSCFGNQNNNNSRGRAGGYSKNQKPRFESKQMHNAVCSKCNRDCQVPFKPSFGKSVLCDQCFSGGTTDRTNDSGELLREMKKLNAKVDHLIDVLTMNASENKRR